MIVDRNSSEFFDLVGRGLAGVPLQDFVNEMFSEKYKQTPTTGFTWDDKLQISFEYKQLRAELGIHAMATYVDRNSDAPYRSLDGVELTSGSIPRFKHGFALDEDVIREQWAMLEDFGQYTPKMREALQILMFNSFDQLIGGNHKTLEDQRHQAISKGKIEILDKNNPQGIQNITLDFIVPEKNFEKLTAQKRWWTDAGRTTEGTASNPLVDLKDMVKRAKRALYPVGHFEVDQNLWDDFINHSKVRTMLGYMISPLASTEAQALQVGHNILDDVIKARIEAHVKMPIVIIDSIVAVERFNKDKQFVAKELIRPFEGDRFVLVPDGELGTIKAVRPYHVPDIGCRHSLFDGGRTLLTETFDAKKKTHYVQSELTALCVPNKAQWFMYLIVE